MDGHFAVKGDPESPGDPSCFTGLQYRDKVSQNRISQSFLPGEIRTGQPVIRRAYPWKPQE